MTETIFDFAKLCLSAAAGGALNSIAGGGTLLTFPALDGVLGGQAAIVANATSTVALFPGSLAATWGYRRELAGTKHWILLLIGPSLLGGILGALLLVLMPDSSFKATIPWLILTAAVLFAAQPTIARWTGIGQEHAPPTSWKAAGVVTFQFLVAVYGGYFGAGIGILMLSSLAMMGLSDIHRMNALKTVFASAINGVSVAVFIVVDKIDWHYAPAMIVSAIVGGYFGARGARRLDRNLVRRGVVVMGFALAAWYFYKQLATQ